MVLGRAYDIRRNTAEQQAALAALQSLGLQVPTLARHSSPCIGSGTEPMCPLWADTHIRAQLRHKAGCLLAPDADVLALALAEAQVPVLPWR